MTTSSLFEPVAVGASIAKNRVVMAPMTRSRAADDGMPRPLMATYYAQRAGAGLIVSEGVAVNAEGRGFLNIPGIHTEQQARAWSEVAGAVHAAGSLIFMQLWHVGRVAHADNLAPGLQPVAPSAVACGRTVVTRAGAQAAPTPHALSDAEVERTIADYAAAGRRAVEAGFDGVEIHAANGYLPSQFLHESTNRRAPPWGGSVEARARFVLALVDACAAAVGADRTALRLSPFAAFNGATSSDEAALYAHLLSALGRQRLAYLHVVRSEVEGSQTVDASGRADVLAFVRPRWPGTLIAAGNYNAQTAQADLDAGRTDLVAFGRDFIANPDLATRLQRGLPLAPRDPAAWYGNDAKGYTDFPVWAGDGTAPAAAATPGAR